MPMSRKNHQSEDQIGNILHTVRMEKNLDRELVAEKVDISVRHLTAIELGEKNPSVETLRRLIRCLNVPSDRLFYPEMYIGDSQLDEINRLSAVCSPSQRRLVVAFIKMLLEQTELE